METENKTANNESLEDYNPFEHRNILKPTSDIRSLANLQKAFLGSGILAMPLAFANSGWLIGLIGTAIIAFVCGHCIQIFIETSRGCCKLDKKPLLGYAETCRAAFANGPKSLRSFASTAYTIAEFSLVFSYVGVCCIYTFLMADSIKQPFDRYVLSSSPPVEYYCLVLLVPLCLLVQIRHLKWLAPFALFANILLVATFAICLYYTFGDSIDFTNKTMVGDSFRYPAFLSTVIFAMDGIGLAMPVENTMKKPEHFLGCPSILVIAVTSNFILYSILGLFGYFRFGDDLRGSVTLNLPINDLPAVLAKFFIAISIFFTYPLHFFVVLDTLTRFLNPYISETYRNVSQIFIRIAVVLFCGAMGIALPMLEQIINIVGSLFFSILGLIIPAVVETVFRWNNLGRYNWVMWKNILVVLFGLGSMVSGLMVTIMDIRRLSLLNKKQ